MTTPLPSFPRLTDDELRITYPALFARHRWGNIDLVGFHVRPAWPPLERVQSVNVVPFVGAECLLILDDRGSFQLPGGTREEGESLEETGRRELMEEVGVTFAACHPFGWFDCHSHDPQPWRPFLAHPDFTRALAWADVERIGQPTNPEDAEQIAEVRAVSVEEAARALRRGGRAELADIYRLAAFVRDRTGSTEASLA